MRNLDINDFLILCDTVIEITFCHFLQKLDARKSLPTQHAIF